MQAKFLLIDEVQEQPWQEVLVDALAPLGSLAVASEKTLRGSSRLGCFDVIIIDATTVDDMATLIDLVKAQHGAAKLVVVTALPTWRRARIAFQAGVTDYVRKSLNIADLRQVFAQILAARSPVAELRGIDIGSQ